MAGSERLIAQRVAIVGLGLMGGSLALGLRGKCQALLGIDANPEVCALALENGVVDRAASEAGALLPEASLVILATPVSAILELIAALPGLHPGKAVVLDLGSTKVRIAAALEALPERFAPLGGHPMCGKETSSLHWADPAIYQSAPFVLTRLQTSTAPALALAEELVLALGARPIWLEPELHDRWVAATSHLPYLLANALALSVPGEAAPVVGPGFRSTARLAPSSPAMMLDVLKTNRENILDSLAILESRLDALTAALEAQDYATLEGLLAAGAARYAALVEAKGRSDPPPPQSGLSPQ